MRTADNLAAQAHHSGLERGSSTSRGLIKDGSHIFSSEIVSFALLIHNFFKVLGNVEQLVQSVLIELGMRQDALALQASNAGRSSSETLF